MIVSRQVKKTTRITQLESLTRSVRKIKIKEKLGMVSIIMLIRYINLEGSNLNSSKLMQEVIIMHILLWYLINKL